MAADDTHHTRHHVTPRYLLPDTAHGTSRDGSHPPLCWPPPSPPQHHVLAPRTLRALPPHRTEHCLSPSSSGYAPAHPTLPCGVTETSPLRGSEWHRTTKTDKHEMVRDVGLPQCDSPTRAATALHAVRQPYNATSFFILHRLFYCKDRRLPWVRNCGNRLLLYSERTSIPAKSRSEN